MIENMSVIKAYCFDYMKHVSCKENCNWDYKSRVYLTLCEILLDEQMFAVIGIDFDFK